MKEDKDTNRMDLLCELASDLVAPFEGFEPNPYRCPGGLMTFGYGSLVRNYKDVSFPITKVNAKKHLQNDLKIAYHGVRQFTKVPLNNNQYVALISFVHNLGAGSYHRSTLRSKLNAGDYKGAAKEFPRWNRAAGKVLAGLTKRRAAEMDLFLKETTNEL